MNHIIHFTNEQYGRPFLRCYDRLPEQVRRRLRVTLVFSAKNRAAGRIRPVRWLICRLHRFRLQWRYGKNGIRIRLEDDVNDPRFIAALPENAAGFCTGFNQIFGGALIARLQPFVNVHPSVLPYYRGPVPSYWCLQNGEKQTGFTFHRVTRKIDAGEVLYQGTVPVIQAETADYLDDRIAEAAAPVFYSLLTAVAEGRDWPAFTRTDAARVYAVPVGYRSFAG